MRPQQPAHASNWVEKTISQSEPSAHSESSDPPREVIRQQRITWLGGSVSCIRQADGPRPCLRGRRLFLPLTPPSKPPSALPKPTPPL